MRPTERIMNMNQTRGVLRQQHGRAERLVWNHGSIILLAIVTFVVSIAFWRAAVTESRLTLASQIDREDTQLCIKFGFAIATARHDACKLELLDLRRSHEELVGRTSLP
jgi:hypothetical protein